MATVHFTSSTRALGAVALAGMLCLATASASLATPSDQDAGAAGVRVSHVHVERGGGFFSRPTAAAYIQVYDRADPPIGRTAVTGLPGSAFSAVESGQPVAVNVRPARADEPIALVVVADNSNDRGWLPPGPKHADSMLYLRDAATRVLKEFPESGRYALYSMSNTAEATPPLADRQSALNAAAQLQLAPQARLLERLERAVDALKTAPPGWRRVVVVLSDGNSAFGRSYELVGASAVQAQVAVFAVGTVDPNQAFPFLDWLAQETGGQSWLFDKASLQPTPDSPVLLDLLVDQATRAIKGAYRLEYTLPDSGRTARDLTVTVKSGTGTALQTKPFSYQAAQAPRPLGGLVLFAGGLLLAAAAAGLLYYLRMRPVRTDFFLVGHGATAGHVPEEYLYTNWRPLGRGGRGYQLKPEDPHFAGISRTHIYLRVRHWRRVRSAGGQSQLVGSVEVHAGKPSSGVGLNTAFVFNDLTGLRALSEHPYQLQPGDLIILQGAGHTGQGLGGLPQGVCLRLGYVTGTTTEAQEAGEIDTDKTVVETAEAAQAAEQAVPEVAVGADHTIVEAASARG